MTNYNHWDDSDDLYSNDDHDILGGILGEDEESELDDILNNAMQEDHEDEKIKVDEDEGEEDIEEEPEE